MSMSIRPDGIVLDHVAEFIYCDSDRIRTLYDRDRASYVDALARFLQTLVTHKKVRVLSGKQKTEAASLLCERLALHERLELADNTDPADQLARRVSILADLNASLWKKICRALEQDSWLVEGLCGHVEREVLYFFGLVADANWNSSHYVEPNEALELPGTVRRRLLSASQDSLRRAGASQTPEAIEEFIDRTFTTYYLRYFENDAHYSGQYLPGYTRGNLPFLWKDTPARRVFNFIAECYAADMLVKCRSRDRCLEYALDWCDGKEGRRVQAELGDIEAALRSSSLQERARWADEVSRALKSRGEQEGVAHKVMRGAHAVGAIVTALAEPVGGLETGIKGLQSLGGKQRVGDSYRWVLEIPTKDRVHVARKTRELLG